MVNLTAWAARWGVSFSAVLELQQMMGAVDTDPTLTTSGTRSEAAVQAMVRLEASQKGCRLWRNNVGALKDSRGVPVRYGLMNDNPALNKKVKSPDLIGIRPVVVTPDMVGQTLGVFLAREVKEEGWQFSNTAHERAQLTAIELINALGGDAAFANKVGTL